MDNSDFTSTPHWPAGFFGKNWELRDPTTLEVTAIEKTVLITLQIHYLMYQQTQDTALKRDRLHVCRGIKYALDLMQPLSKDATVESLCWQAKLY